MYTFKSFSCPLTRQLHWLSCVPCGAHIFSLEMLLYQYDFWVYTLNTRQKCLVEVYCRIQLYQTGSLSENCTVPHWPELKIFYSGQNWKYFGIGQQVAYQFKVDFVHLFFRICVFHCACIHVHNTKWLPHICPSSWLPWEAYCHSLIYTCAV